MKASELIKELVDFMKVHGDVNVQLGIDGENREIRRVIYRPPANAEVSLVGESKPSESSF